MGELALQLAKLARKAPPLVLVVDMDETLVHVDEDGVTQSRSCLCLYRTEMFSFFSFLRQVFSERLFLVLWSTGCGDYVKHMLSLLGLSDFDLVLTRSDAEEAKKIYGACKSPSFIQDRSKFVEWLEDMQGSPMLPVWAIIDDKARQNTSVDEPYHFTFSPTPLSLKSVDMNKMSARVQSLFEYADILVFQLLLQTDGNLSLCHDEPEEPVFTILSA